MGVPCRANLLRHCFIDSCSHVAVEWRIGHEYSRGNLFAGLGKLGFRKASEAKRVICVLPSKKGAHLAVAQKSVVKMEP